MEDNPYVKLLGTMRGEAQDQTPMFYRFGTVISTSPLKIETSGTVQGGADLLKNHAVVSLEIGDDVLLLPIEDDQRFVILCKVVGV